MAAASEGVEDPVEALLSGCEAYVAFALENPALYRVLFAQAVPEPPPADPGAPVLDERYPPVGGEAFALLVEGIERCAAAGRCASWTPSATPPPCGWASTGW